MKNSCEGIYDLTMVKELCRHDKKVIRSLAYQFVDTISTAMNSMRSDANEGDYQCLARTAHKIKPVLATFAMTEATELVARIESEVKEQVPQERLSELVGRLEQVTTVVMEDIRYQYLN